MDKRARLLRVMNADQDWPAIFYGLHMVPGVAEYKDGPGGKPHRIFVSGDTAKRMDPSFEGKPVYVEHVDDEQPNEQNKTVEGVKKDERGDPEKVSADGYVIESFYNPADGAHWAKFIVVSKAGVDAIKRKWVLSNCYQPESLGPGGEWHGVQYDREFLANEYKHLAIVANPRYRESIVLTPDEFKQYNEGKLKEIAALRNSADVPKNSSEKGEPKMKLMDILFGKKNGKVERIENADEIGKISVKLGNGRQATVSELINNARRLNDEDYEKLMSEVDVERPEHNADEKDLENTDELDEKKNKKKNKRKMSAEDDELENADDEDKEKNSDEDELENADEEDDKKNRKRNRKRSAADEDKENAEDDELENEEFRGRREEKDFVGNDEMDPLKHVLVLDGEETTVGDMINAHLDLKNKYNTLRQKHSSLREEHVGLTNKFGDDEMCGNDMEIPENEEEMANVLNRLENEEKALETSLDVRRTAIEKIVGRMKNNQEVIARRDQKKKEGLTHFLKIKNAEAEAALKAGGVVVPTETSSSMLARGKAKYGSGNN